MRMENMPCWLQDRKQMIEMKFFFYILKFNKEIKQMFKVYWGVIV